MKRIGRKILTLFLSMTMLLSSLTAFNAGTVEVEAATTYQPHSEYIYMVAQSNGKVVQIDTTDWNRLRATGDAALLDDVANMPTTALFNSIEGTDDRFPGYVTLQAVGASNYSVSATDAGLQATPGSTSTTGWEVMNLIEQEDGLYVIRTTNANQLADGAYVAIDTANQNTLKPTAKSVEEAEKFAIIFPGETPVTPGPTVTPEPPVTPDPEQPSTSGNRHATHMYLVSVSENAVVKINESTRQLEANGDIALLDDVDNLPNTALYYTVPGTDSRFPGYVALRSPFNDQSIAGQASGLVASGGSATQGWEILKLEMQEDGTVAILSTNGDNYVTVDATSKLLVPNSKTVGDAQKFKVVVPENWSEAPAVPAITVEEREMNAVTLTVDVASGLYTSIELYRSETEDGTYTKVASQMSKTFVDDELEAGVTYYYKALAACENVKSESSEVVSVKTLTSPAAAAPVNLDITNSGKEITITWDAAEYATSYKIYRSTGRYSAYTELGTSTEASYKDTVTDSVYNYYYKVVSVNADELESEQSEAIALDIKLFGDTVNLFSPTDDVAQVNSIIKGISDKQMPANTSEFTDDRYAIMFKPGNYDIDTIKIGFYTQVLGLGATPLDTEINNINIDASTNGNSLINFWRGIENIYVNGGSPTSEVKWAASQAAPLRRLYVNGKLHFDDIGKEASGGFLADSQITGQTGSWSQQQFFLRNNTLEGGWYDGVWNIVFLGSENAPVSSSDWANTGYKSYTTVDNTPVVREKPFLYIDEAAGEYKVFVPGLRENVAGTSWSEDNMGTGTSISINDFYIAKADTDTADTINAALDAGKHILFTPGIYHVNKPIEVDNANTVVLGLGLATIICENEDTAFRVADADGITIAGIIVEAGAQGSDTLIQIGTETNDADHSDNPILLSDVFCRVGGARIGKTTACVEINANDVIGDHFWLWRADHGAGANWTESTADHGLVVNGDDVNVYGLFVEHFQKYQTLWNGENGKTFFYQSEIPYDVPYQSDWMSNNGTVNGYASYKVADHVENHEATGLGIYDVFIYTKEYMHLDNAMEVSAGTKVTHVCTVSLGGTSVGGKSGEITHIVNGVGDTVKGGQAQKKGVNYYFMDVETIRAELEELIEEVKDTQQETASDEAWEAFEETLKDAQDAVADEDATATELSAAKNALEDAYAALEKSKSESGPAAESDKKGVASWYYASADAKQRDMSIFNKVGASWVYNWGNTLDAGIEAAEEGIEYVPMLWGPASVNETDLNKLKEGKELGVYENLLTFNEPNIDSQANMTVDQAIELWPQLEATGLRLGSPAGAAAEDAWVEQFMAKAKELGYRVDFLNIHVYQDFTNPASVQSFKEALDRLYAKYQIPIWVTEIGTIDAAANWGISSYDTLSHELAVKYIKEVTDLLESLDYVERYAWFVDFSDNTSGTEFTRLFDITDDSLTLEGIAYKGVGVVPEEPDQPVDPEKPENPFTDVDENSRFYDAIIWAYENGITTGKTETTFEPMADCTRGQVVTFLWRIAGCPEPTITKNPFTDVSETSPFYKAILWAYENGITTGKTATTFQPDTVVTREQFVTFLWRYEGEPASTVENPFVDVVEGRYSTPAILWAYENGITTGKTATTFQPGASVIRQHVVTFLYRAYS